MSRPGSLVRGVYWMHIAPFLFYLGYGSLPSLVMVHFVSHIRAASSLIWTPFSAPVHNIMCLYHCQPFAHYALRATDQFRLDLANVYLFPRAS